MLVQMHAAGLTNMDLDSLAVVSGASAMFGYEPGEFMPKYAFHHRDPDRLVAEATGYATETARLADPEKTWQFVKESIDSGRPASAWHGEMMLIAGYRDAQSPAQREIFVMKDGNGYFTEWWNWEQFIGWLGDGQHFRRYECRVTPKPPAAILARVVTDLVLLSTNVPENIAKAFPKATFGLAGIALWADECDNTGKYPDWSMCHPENPQWTVRNSTAVYLERAAEAGLLPPAGNEHVRNAAEHYRAAYRAWQRAYGLVGYPAPEGAGKVPANRHAAANAVRDALQHEQSAIAELRHALELFPAVTPPPGDRQG
jgi:hypothetical protein